MCSYWYHQASKVLDRMPNTHHHCHCLKKHNLMTWDNLIKFTDSCLVFKFLHGLAPPPLTAFIKQKTTVFRHTGSVTRGDCVIQMRRTAFGLSAFSVRAAHTWSSYLLHLFKTLLHMGCLRLN